MKRIVALLFLLASLQNSARAQDNNLRLVLAAEDSVCSLTDVNMKLSFYNDGKEDLVIYNWLSGNTVVAALDEWLFFTVISEDADTLTQSTIGPRPKMPHRLDTLHIAAGEVYEEVVNLTRHYTLSEEEDDWSRVATDGPYPRRKWAPGEYSVQCRYEYVHSPSWTGGKDLSEVKAVSNRIRVRVESSK